MLPIKTVSIAVIIIILGLTSSAWTKTMHVKKCDNFCGGSKLNPFGKSGTCKDCCLDKGFYKGGECGDFLYRHCRCVLNPAGGFGFQPGAGSGFHVPNAG